MEPAREPEVEPIQEAAPAPAAATPSARAAMPGRPLSPAGIVALQRLVGNAAVADLIADHQRDGAAAAGGIGGLAAGAASLGAGVGELAEHARPELPFEPGAPGQEAEAGEPERPAQAEEPPEPGRPPEASAATYAEQAPEAGETTGPDQRPGTGEPAHPERAPEGQAPPEAEAGVAQAAAAGAAAGAMGAGVAQAAAAGAAAGAMGAGVAQAAGAGARAGAAGAGAAQGAGAAGAGRAGGAATGASAAGTAPQAAGGAAGAAGPAPRREPADDPGFQAMKGKAGAAAGKAKAHRPASAGAAAAQAAAVPPGNEVASQAAGAQVEEMGAQQPGTFDRKAFIAAVQKAIDAAAPKNLEEADDFKGSGKAAQVKGEVGALVKGGKKDAEKDIKTATDAPPDASKAKPKPVTPLAPEEPGQAASTVGASAAMPGPRPPEETDLSSGPAEVDAEMEREGVTEEQLAKANEPDFTAALDARQQARQHSETAPAEYRAQESELLAKGRDEASELEGVQLAGMHGSKVAALAKVAGHQGEAKSEDEAKRAQVATEIQAIYEKAKTDVTAILTGLDAKVDSAFSSGEEQARKQFEDYVGAKMDAYKDDRYSGIFGGARWLKDKLFGMPSEVNAFYSQGRAAYLTAMDAVIGQVADIVGAELNAARLRIAQGRTEVRDYVSKLPADLQKVGKEAEGKLESQFDALDEDVTAKQDALVDSLAQKYVASRDALDSRIEELKAANRGLVAKALDAVVGVVKTILKLKDLLLGVLAKAADVIGDIIGDPIGFLGNLIGGIKSGLDRFVGNIAAHLENGLMGWLFGALGDAGIKLPKTFDLAGIFELVMDVLGLTYRSIRGRVAKIVGEPVVGRMEQTVDVFKKLVTEGPAALWGWVKDKVGDFYDLVLGGIKDFIIERVIRGGITWLLSLLNPAAAFIKACKAIYDIVMFIVERGSQIMEFVHSVLDSIGAIARGQIGVAADKVENALAKALPLTISFLASLLGLGGITDKIREGIDKVRKPIEKAVDFVVLGAVKGFKKMFGGAIGWVKGKYEKGKDWAKAKATAAKDWAKGKAAAVKDRVTGGGEKDAGEAEAPGPEPAADIPVGETITFTAAGEKHTLWYEVQGADSELMVASEPMPVRKRFEGMKDQVKAATPERQAEAAPLVAQGQGIVDAASPKADDLAAAADRRRKGEAVDQKQVIADEKEVVAAERKMSGLLTKLFEALGVGADDEILNIKAPTGGEVRCVRRGNAIVPIGKVAIYLMGLVPSAEVEEMRGINEELQGGLRDQKKREELTKRRDFIRDKPLHNFERSQQMWELVQKAGLDDSVESVNRLLSILLDAGAQPTLAQEVEAGGPGGTMLLQPIWATIDTTGERYLSSVIIRGVKPPPST